ncbi:hypothetical protein Efla_005980 [Eimeria flavescens]
MQQQPDGVAAAAAAAVASDATAVSPQQQQQQLPAAAAAPAAAEKPAAAAVSLAAREDRFLQAALRIRVGEAALPGCLFLPKTAAESKDETGVPRLRLESVPEAMIELTVLLWNSKTQNVFQFLAESFHRLSDDAYTKYLPAESRVAAAAAVQQQLVNNAVLLLTCLELFELGDPPPVAEVSVRLREWIEGGVPAAFMARLLSGLEETPEGEKAVETAFAAALDGLFEGLQGRAVNDYKCPAVGAFRFLSSFKPLATLITQRPFFLPTAAPPFPNSQRGFNLQENSLLGRLLSFTPLNGPVIPKGQASCVQRIFAGSQALSPSYLQSAIQTLRQDLQNVIDLNAQVVKNLCRAGKEERQRVLLWFAAVLSSNEARAKAAHAQLMLQRNIPESADPLHSFLLKAQGQNSFGFCINVCHLLLLLVEPIKPEKIAEVSPFYGTCKAEGDAARGAIAASLQTESLLGDEETAAAARDFYNSIATQEANAKFTTEIFWLAIRSIRLCFNPCATEFLTWIEYYQQRHETSRLSPDSQETKNIIAEVLGWRAILLLPPATAAAAAATAAAATAAAAAPLPLLLLPPGGPDSPSRPPPQFALLPSGIVEDVFVSIRHLGELQAVYAGIRGSYGGEVSPCSSTDVELVAAACIAIMGSPRFFRSVHTRCDGACRTLHRLFLLDDFRLRLQSLPVARAFLLPALLEVFVDSERGSYYDRINFRIPIVDMLRQLLKIEEYKTRVKELAEATPEKFLHVVHLLLNDIAALVDQAMEALVEIRRRQLEGRDNDEAAVAGQAGARGAAAAAAAAPPAAAAASARQQAESDSDGDEVAESLEGRSPLQRESWSRLQGTARDLCSLGLSACALFTQLSRHCGSAISSSSSILPQAVTTLDCCLDHLVGPRCLQLKVRSMETYNFRPKDWLSNVLEAFVYLGESVAAWLALQRSPFAAQSAAAAAAAAAAVAAVQTDKTKGEAVTAEILRDGRYYKHANIAKACRIARREGLMPGVLLEEFCGLVKRLAEVEEAGKELDIDDIPVEFLDPIMSDLMSDPVLLPTSNVVVDRRNIERHLMSEPSDPFNSKLISPLVKSSYLAS